MASKVEIELAENGWILHIHSSFSTRTEVYDEWSELMMALNRELNIPLGLSQQ